MRESRSFKEFVKNNLDIRMWKTIKDYFSTMEPSILELRLNRVCNIGEIELYDTDLQFLAEDNTRIQAYLVTGNLKHFPVKFFA